MGRVAEIFDVWVRDNQTLAQLERVITDEYDRLTTANTSLRGEVEELRDSLRRYGTHKIYCDQVVSPKASCTCGFIAALAAKE